jgi:hypothetical protein
MRYAVVMEEPSADTVAVAQPFSRTVTWKLKDLTWRKKDGAVVDFNQTADFVGKRR